MKKLFSISAATVVMLMSIKPVFAHCPLCTAAVGAAAVSASYFGLDAVIIGLFVGAFGVSTGLWIGRKIRKQYVKFQLPLVVAASFLLTTVPLTGLIDEHLYLPVLWAGAGGSLLNKVYFVDKMLFGSVLGGVTSLAAFWLHLYVKRVKGRALVPFQGIIFTVLMLIAVGTALFFVFQ